MLLRVSGYSGPNIRFCISSVFSSIWVASTFRHRFTYAIAKLYMLDRVSGWSEPNIRFRISSVFLCICADSTFCHRFPYATAKPYMLHRVSGCSAPPCSWILWIKKLKVVFAQLAGYQSQLNAFRFPTIESLDKDKDGSVFCDNV